MVAALKFVIGERTGQIQSQGDQGSHWSWVRRIAIRLRKIVSTQWTVSICFIFVCDHGIQAELGGRAKKQSQTHQIQTNEDGSSPALPAVVSWPCRGLQSGKAGPSDTLQKRISK